MHELNLIILCSLSEYYILWRDLGSSAKMARVLAFEIASGISLMNCVHNRGPSIEPGGTPKVTERHSEVLTSIATLCNLPFRQLNNHCNKEPKIPDFLSLYIKCT